MKTFVWTFWLSCLLAMILVTGCATRPADPEDSPSDVVTQTAPELPQRPAEGRFTPLSSQAEAIWRSQLQALAGQPIQAACQPFRVAARGAHRGSVVLYHGFTACPQQYWELADQLAAAGFNVFVPLLPGHGRAYRTVKASIVDDYSQLPGDGEYVKYQTLADQMTAMLRDEAQAKVVVGLSLGGVVAAAALERAPEVYDRALLMTPLFDVVAAKKPYLPSANAVIPSHQIDWGRDCELERQGGRGGICQFQIRHVRAGQRLGEEALRKLSQVTTPVQIVGVEGDQAANNEAIGLAVHSLKHGQGCLYQHGVTHSMLSRYDAPDDKKFWLSSLEQQTLRFVRDGRFFERVQPAHELGLLRCRIP